MFATDVPDGPSSRASRAIIAACRRPQHPRQSSHMRRVAFAWGRQSDRKLRQSHQSGHMCANTLTIQVDSCTQHIKHTAFKGAVNQACFFNIMLGILIHLYLISFLSVWSFQNSKLDKTNQIQTNAGFLLVSLSASLRPINVSFLKVGWICWSSGVPKSDSLSSQTSLV
jgi:hypothetical protein